MHSQMRALRCVVGLLLCLAACAQTDPLTAPGRWTPASVNEANLAVQLATPADLLEGQGSDGADGQQAVAAVARLRRGQLKALADGNAPAPQAAAATPANGTAGTSEGN